MEESVMNFGWKKQIAAVAVTGAVLIIGSLSNPRQLLAQAKAALVQDIDQPARQPFQATVSVNSNNFVFTPVSIPSGKRLVVEYVAMSGAAASAGGPIQPVILLNSSVTGSAPATFYVQPAPSTVTPQQFYNSGPVTIYADSLNIGGGYSGFAPSFLVFNVVISGHLVSIP
jgi:hypothetical protein